ncbi:MAG: MBL fold metallo-hydrolase [Chitinophagaceae bacterium]
MKLYPIHAGNFKLDGGAMFGVVPKSIWNKLNPADENNMCSWALRCLLIEDSNRLILIDTGMGNKQDAKFFSYYYMFGNETLESSLAEHGFSKNDITDVILTHLHFDHCGGAIHRVDDKLKPAFPNAQFWSNQEHWKWATEPNAREKASFLKENILPMQESGQLSFIDASAIEIKQNQLAKVNSNIIQGLSFRYANGHTKAMMLPQIQYGNKTIAYMADLLPSVAHIPLPYVMAYDMFPMLTLTEKKVFLEEAAINNYILFFEHDLVNECCTVELTEKGVKVKEIGSLETLVNL